MYDNIETAGFFDSFKQSNQIKIRLFFYSKLWNLQSLILLLIVLQMLLFQYAKVKEYRLLLRVEAALAKYREYDEEEN